MLLSLFYGIRLFSLPYPFPCVFNRTYPIHIGFPGIDLNRGERFCMCITGFGIPLVFIFRMQNMERETSHSNPFETLP